MNMKQQLVRHSLKKHEGSIVIEEGLNGYVGENDNGEQYEQESVPHRGMLSKLKVQPRSTKSWACTRQCRVALAIAIERFMTGR